MSSEVIRRALREYLHSATIRSEVSHPSWLGGGPNQRSIRPLLGAGLMQPSEARSGPLEPGLPRGGRRVGRRTSRRRG
jgi:hypothetical protein